MRIYVDMDGVLCDYETAWHNENVIDAYPYFPQSRKGFFSDLKPLPGAIEGMRALVRAGHDVYILTAPSVDNLHCWSEKAEWIKDYLGEEWLPKLIITRQKQLLCDGQSYLIDDIDFSRAGQQVFDAKNLLIHFGNNGWDWARIVRKFTK